MCQCLTGGSCVCDSQQEQPKETTNSEAETPNDDKPVITGCKRKQPCGKALEPSIAAHSSSSCCQNQSKLPVVSSCCSSSSKILPSASAASTSSSSPLSRPQAYTDPTLLPSATSSTSQTPSLTSDSLSASILTLPELPMQVVDPVHFTLPPPTTTTSSSKEEKHQGQTPYSPYPEPPPLQSQHQQSGLWSGSVTPAPGAFDDWVWGDILVPDSLLPPPPPSMLEAIAQGACRSCGPGCKCGEGQCQCGHVQALQRSLLQSTSDPLDRAFAESVLGLPLSSQFPEPYSATPATGNLLWSAGHMPGLASPAQPSSLHGQTQAHLQHPIALDYSAPQRSELPELASNPLLWPDQYVNAPQTAASHAPESFDALFKTSPVPKDVTSAENIVQEPEEVHSCCSKAGPNVID